MDESAKEKNFHRVKWQLNVLRTGKITEDFVDDCKDFIGMFREYFPDFRYINTDVQSRAFRKNCDMAEELFRKLFSQYKDELYFNTDTYKELLERIIYMAEYVESDVSLADMMASMTF